MTSLPPITDNPLVKAFKDSSNWIEEIARQGEGVYYTPFFLTKHNTKNHIHFKNYRQGYAGYTVKINGENDGSHKIDELPKNTTPDTFLNYYKDLDPVRIKEKEEKEKEKEKVKQTAILASRQNVASNPFLPRALQLKKKSGGNRKKTKKKLSNKEIKKMVKLTALVLKCQFKYCKSHKWGTKEYRKCTKKNCKKFLKKLNL